MTYTIEDFMARLYDAERRRDTAIGAPPPPDPRLEELERENACLRNFVADLLLGKSA